MPPVLTVIFTSLKFLPPPLRPDPLLFLMRQNLQSTHGLFYVIPLKIFLPNRTNLPPPGVFWLSFFVKFDFFFAISLVQMLYPPNLTSSRRISLHFYSKRIGYPQVVRYTFFPMSPFLSLITANIASGAFVPFVFHPTSFSHSVLLQFVSA